MCLGVSCLIKYFYCFLKYELCIMFHILHRIVQRICFDLYATVRILYINKFMYAVVTIIIASKLRIIQFTCIISLEEKCRSLTENSTKLKNINVLLIIMWFWLQKLIKKNRWNFVRIHYRIVKRHILIQNV